MPCRTVPQPRQSRGGEPLENQERNKQQRTRNAHLAGQMQVLIVRVGGEGIARLIHDVQATPQPVVDRLRELLAAPKGR